MYRSSLPKRQLQIHGRIAGSGARGLDSGEHAAAAREAHADGDSEEVGGPQVSCEKAR